MIRSTAEHWFTDSQVSTIYFVLRNVINNEPTKFVSFNFKLSDYFGNMSNQMQLAKIETLYSEIDNCDLVSNPKWKKDTLFPDVYHKNDGTIDVSIISRSVLEKSLTTETNWSQFFTAVNPLEIFEPYITQYSPNIFTVIRGERTGWNDMFIIKNDVIDASGISSKFLVPYVKRPDEISTILFSGRYKYSAFVCSNPLSSLDLGTRRWIRKFENTPNKNGSQTVSEANANHTPFWYSISPKSAHIVTAINPYERFFFSYSPTAFAIDQRMIAMQVKDNQDIELIAALLNSISTLLTLEFKGTSRNLGALDLNANFLKRVRLLNPNLLSESAKKDIKKAFDPLKNRPVYPVYEECKMEDRINFDRIVLRAFGINESKLDSLYKLLCNHVRERVSMKVK